MGLTPKRESVADAAADQRLTNGRGRRYRQPRRAARGVRHGAEGYGQKEAAAAVSFYQCPESCDQRRAVAGVNPLQNTQPLEGLVELPGEEVALNLTVFAKRLKLVFHRAGMVVGAGLGVVHCVAGGGGFFLLLAMALGQ